MINRIKAIKKVRDSLNNGGVSIGSWMQILNPSIAEILGQSGYDWVCVDMEHGSGSLHLLPDLFRAIELGESLPLVRLANKSVSECSQALDAGAGGVIVPMVETAEDLIQIRNASRWPPSGSRGVGYCRANLYGKNFSSYSQESQEPLLVAMIENIKAIENIKSILAVDGLDSLFIGPYDLSASLGVTGQFDDPKFKNAINEILIASKGAKKPVGIHIIEPSVEEIHKRTGEGYTFIAYSMDSVMLRTVSACNFLEKKKD
jgi:2-dehydro-3-deoxyglucarate aldolase